MTVAPKNIFLWHVHGSWTTAFVEGAHRYFVPVLPDRGPDGRGRARTWEWPSSVVEVEPTALTTLPIDIAIFQRPHEVELFERWTGRRLGGDFVAIYLEHNAPRGDVNAMEHPYKDRSDLEIVHVTHFNELFWDCGTTRTTVIEHGIPDPGYRYRGDIPRAAVAINEPVRRARVTGTDLLQTFESAIPIDLFGIQSETLGGIDVPQRELHDAIARRRVYLHPMRWTSLGLTLIEAMQLGMPVVALATTEASEAVPREAGYLSTNVTALCEALDALRDDHELARTMGLHARSYACERYGLDRFLAAWDRLFERGGS